MIKLKFTVITVCYNSENSIRKTINSVLNQTYLPYEYLIIDGLSTDNTVNIARDFQEKFNKKNIHFDIISEKDLGIYNAMNKGIKKAHGDFVSFLNTGDWYELDALYNINKLYNTNKFDLIYGGLNYIKPNGFIIEKKSHLDKFIISSRNWNHPSMFLRRGIYQKYYFDEHYKIYADFELYLKLRKCNLNIEVTQKIITNFVADGISTRTSIKSAIIRANEKYNAYINNGYSKFYFVESFCWEIFKSLYFKINSVKRE